MRDPTVPETTDRKKIMFYDSSTRQTKLRIRCDFDGISQSQFFRMMITGYIEDDELISSFLEKCKEKYKIQGQQKRKKIVQLQNGTKKTIATFALGDEEVENIFDIIEMETDI
jgi:hypothetical protein